MTVAPVLSAALAAPALAGPAVASQPLAGPAAAAQVPATLAPTVSFAEGLQAVDDFFYTYILAILLVAVGIYFTVRTRGVQFRLMGEMLRTITRSRGGAQDGISSFQAFAVGLAARVGIGNVAGVAIAIVAGGPGAMFWMWVVALIGMATSFIESTLAQVFKEPGRNNTYKGGPAYYISHGLGSKVWARIFAAMCIVSVGVTVVMVQTNALAGIVNASLPQAEHWMIGLAIMALTAPVVLGGVKKVARVAEWAAPVTALIYVLVTLVVIILNIAELPAVFGAIVANAFGARQVLGGVTGGIVVAIVNGVRRGLFSNEAGLGTVPNAAGTATVSHPVKQGLIQSFGVFVDTIIVCTATGLLILLATDTYQPGKEGAVGAVLTQQAVAEHLGSWSTWPMAAIIFVLVFTTVIGCYSYSQVNVEYLGGRRRAEVVFGLVLTAAAFAGAVVDLPVVWALTDIALGLLGVINLVAILRLAPWALGALRDYEHQKARGIDEPVFTGHGNPLLPGDTLPGVWEKEPVEQAS